MSKQKIERYYGYIKIGKEKIKVSVESTSVDGALGQIRHRHPEGFKIVSIDKNTLAYPELKGIAVPPKPEKKPKIEHPVLEGLKKAYSQVYR